MHIGARQRWRRWWTFYHVAKASEYRYVCLLMNVAFILPSLSFHNIPFRRFCRFILFSLFLPQSVFCFFFLLLVHFKPFHILSNKGRAEKSFHFNFVSSSENMKRSSATQIALLADITYTECEIRARAYIDTTIISSNTFFFRLLFSFIRLFLLRSIC